MALDTADDIFRFLRSEGWEVATNETHLLGATSYSVRVRSQQGKHKIMRGAWIFDEDVKENPRHIRQRLTALGEELLNLTDDKDPLA